MEVKRKLEFKDKKKCYKISCFLKMDDVFKSLAFRFHWIYFDSFKRIR